MDLPPNPPPPALPRHRPDRALAQANMSQPSKTAEPRGSSSSSESEGVLARLDAFEKDVLVVYSA